MTLMTTVTGAPTVTGKPQVLLVSGVTSLRDGAAQLLGIEGYNVLQASCGAGALKALKDHAKIKVVIVDSQARETDSLEAMREERPLGVELVHRIKRQKAAVQVLYWCADRNLAISAFEAGASGLLIKGDSPNRMIEAVEELTRVSRYN